MRNDARPIFYKSQLSPFPLKEKISKELGHLEQEGIIEKVTHSECKLLLFFQCQSVMERLECVVTIYKLLYIRNFAP